MSVLKKPIITEKSQALNSQGKYTFEVTLNANKIQIAKAIEDMYNVKVTRISTLRQFGKKKSRSTRTRVSSGLTPTVKKAIVTLADGDLIDFYADL